ncbi:hypothetical protein, partial [Vibrio cholerae]|uniref:hypothetical protein n=1 Tax=Vibrio cholerae TaxID=666 RepID=UPI003F6931D7
DFTVPALKEFAFAVIFKFNGNFRGQLKISSWNVAGWKSILGKGFVEYVKDENPDIICIQETKVLKNFR